MSKMGNVLVSQYKHKTFYSNNFLLHEYVNLWGFAYGTKGTQFY